MNAVTLPGIVAQATARLGQSPAEAETLPPEAYTSQAFFDLEMERIFRRDWFCVGHVAQLPNVGDYFTVDYLNELLVVARAPDRIRVMSRVCLHRWAPVAAGSGNARNFACPFHKWVYGLDGQLLGAPLMDKAAGFDPKRWCLPEIRSEIVDGIIFITLSKDAPSAGERLAGLRGKLAPFRPAELKIAYSWTVELNFNWKIAAETFAECYHHIGAHRDTLEPQYPATLSHCEGGPNTGWTECHQLPRPGFKQEKSNIVGLPKLPGADAMTGFDMYIVFPSCLIGVNPERFNLTSLTPLGPARTRWTRHVMVNPAALDEPDFADKIAALRGKGDAIFAEDVEVNEMQQAGAASSHAPIGRLSDLEHTVWHLANYVRERLAD